MDFTSYMDQIDENDETEYRSPIDKRTFDLNDEEDLIASEMVDPLLEKCHRERFIKRQEEEEKEKIIDRHTIGQAVKMGSTKLNQDLTKISRCFDEYIIELNPIVENINSSTQSLDFKKLGKDMDKLRRDIEKIRDSFNVQRREMLMLIENYKKLII